MANQTGDGMKNGTVHSVVVVLFFMFLIGCGEKVVESDSSLNNLTSSGGSDDSLNLKQDKGESISEGVVEPKSALTRDVYLQMSNPSGVTLRWQTDVATPSEVMYSASLDSLEALVTQSEVSDTKPQADYLSTNTVEVSSSSEAAIEHEITLTNLDAEQRYYYIVGNKQQNFTVPSEDRYFETSPLEGDKQGTRVLVLGNTGMDKQAMMAVRRGYKVYSNALATDIMLLLGNNVTPDAPQDYNRTLFLPYKDYLKNASVWPALGALELLDTESSTGLTSKAESYFNTFKLPQQGEVGGSISNTEAYYAFNHGDAHFISLNTLDVLEGRVDKASKKMTCVTTEEKFIPTAWPILDDYCAVCHRDGAPGLGLKLVPNNVEASYQRLTAYTKTPKNSQKIIDRSIGLPVHGGGNVLGSTQSTSHIALKGFVNELANPELCSNQSPTNSPTDESATASKMLFSTEMVDWLKSDLATSTSKWKVVYMHHGPYSKGSNDSDTDLIAAAIREQLVPLFDQYDVDLVLTGQSQSYERSYLLKGHTGSSNMLAQNMVIKTNKNVYPKPLTASMKNGVAYVVAGAASKNVVSELNHPAMSKSINASGSVVLDIVDNRLEVLFVDAAGQRRDDFSITKGNDVIEPRLINAIAQSANKISLVFNERLNADIGDASAYTLTGPDGTVKIYRASLAANQRVITLTVDDLPKRKKLVVNVDGVADLSGNMSIAESIELRSRFSSDYIKPVEPVIPVNPKKPIEPEVPVEPKLPIEPPVEPKPPVLPEPPVAPKLPVEPPVLPKPPVEPGLPIKPEIQLPEPPKSINKAPMAVNDNVSTKSETPVLINPVDNDNDPENDQITLVDYDAITPNGGVVKRISSKGFNIALDGKASQSSTGYGGEASRAIDGNKSSRYQSKSITHTNNKVDSWWQVEFKQAVTELDRIFLLNRVEQSLHERLSNFRVSVFNGDMEVFGQDYFKTGSVEEGFEIKLPQGIVGDRVRIQINGKNNKGNGYLSLAEVQVWTHGVESQLQYTPANGFSGADAFTYVIADTSENTATATVTINVAPKVITEPPVIVEPPIIVPPVVVKPPVVQPPVVVEPPVIVEPPVVILPPVIIVEPPVIIEPPVVVEPPKDCAAKTFYANTVKADMSSCFGCHKAGGIAGGTKLILSANDDTFSLNALTGYGRNAAAIQKLLNKAIGVPKHAGGNLFGNANSSKYKNLESLYKQVDDCKSIQKPVVLPPVKPKPPVSPTTSSIIDNVTAIGSKETLRKAAILMAGRLPTANEYAKSVTEDGMRKAVRDLMQGERFAEFILDTGNRTFLTAGVPEPEMLAGDFTEFKKLRDTKNSKEYDAVVDDMRREPLELLRYIVENDRSYKEVLTADYTMVTKRLQKAYDATLVSGFSNGNDWAPARIKAISQRSDVLNKKAYPHAGVITTAAWLSRFPTTASNRNRHRSAKFFDQFLGVDIESFGQRPIDDSANSNFHVPTMENPNCLACHTMMDPVAGSFANWGDSNQYWQEGIDSLDSVYKGSEYYLTKSGEQWYKSGDEWYRDTILPGFEGRNMPGGHGRFNENDNLEVLLPRDGWKVISSTTADRSSPASKALDGNEKTFWHTDFKKIRPPFPHHFRVDMGQVNALSVIRYVPRQGNFGARHIKRYEVLVSMDGKNWTSIASGRFKSNDNSAKDIKFTSTKARYFELRNLEPFDSKAINSSMAELYAIAEIISNDNTGRKNANGGKDRLQWLAREAVEDSRFAMGAVRFWYTGVFGQRPLTSPQDTSAEDYAGQLAAFNTQNNVLEAVAQDFEKSGYKVRDLLVALLSSDLFRADAIETKLSNSQAIALNNVGVGRLLTPAEVNAKTNAVIGQPLFDDPQEGLGLLFGGFDGGNVLTEGVTDITPAVLTAYEIAMSTLVCEEKLVNKDFSQATSQRNLMPYVEKATKPDANGEAEIKRNIQYLVSRFIGKDIPLDNAEIIQLYNLFKAVYENTQAEPTGLRVECERGVSNRDKAAIRGWNAVITYLMTDFGFLGE